MMGKKLKLKFQKLKMNSFFEKKKYSFFVNVEMTLGYNNNTEILCEEIVRIFQTN
jgi:hypothetical protein